MKKALLLTLTLIMTLHLVAQTASCCDKTTYTRQYSDKQIRKAKKWVDKGVWKNDFTKAIPAEMVNCVDFMTQYNANKEEWRAVFRWLQDTDLHSLPSGNYPIPGTELEAKVQVDVNKYSADDLKAGKGSESHRKKIDFMYVVDGIEGFAAIDHETSTVKTPYNEKKDRVDYHFNADRLKIYNSVPGTFNIMFPDDWHIAKVKTSLTDQNIKVIVIKINYR